MAQRSQEEPPPAATRSTAGRLDAPVLLVTKLHPPFVPAQAVARERLFERLRGGRGMRLTLVGGPAGFGKSTLLAAWRERESGDASRRLVDARRAGRRVDYSNDDRAPLLFIAGSDDHLMPPSIQRSNAKHYKSTTVTEVKEYPGPHLLPAAPGWEAVADYALEWALAHAGAPRTA